MEQESKIRVSFYAAAELVQRIDALAAKTYSNRTHWIVQAMLEKAKREEAEDVKDVS